MGEEGREDRRLSDSLPEGVTRSSRPLSHLCPVCGDEVEGLKIARGNPQIYCTPACRTQAWRMRREMKHAKDG